MNCDTISSNWLDQIKAKLICPSSLTTFQIKVAALGFMIQELLCSCSDAFDEYEEAIECNKISQGETLEYYYDRIQCGDGLTESQYEWCLAELSRLKLICCEAKPPVDTSMYLAKIGQHTWAGGADTSDSISVVGLLSTDLVFAQVAAQSTDETIVLAANDHANDQIDLTLSANGADGVTKINYQVWRVA